MLKYIKQSYSIYKLNGQKVKELRDKELFTTCSTEVNINKQTKQNKILECKRPNYKCYRTILCPTKL